MELALFHSSCCIYRVREIRLSTNSKHSFFNLSSIAISGNIATLLFQTLVPPKPYILFMIENIISFHVVMLFDPL